MKRFILLIICSIALGAALTKPNTAFYIVISVLLAGSISILLFSLCATFFAAKPAPHFNNTIDDRSSENHVSDTVVLQATMDAVREGVLVIDNSMRAVSCNKVGQAIFSAITGDIVGKRLSEITRLPSVLTAFTSALNHGELAEVKIEMNYGEKHIFDLRVAPLYLPDRSKICGAIGLFFDVTKLERLEHVRQEWLSNVSHELRTPLTSILASVETLEEDAINDHQNNKRFLSVIRRNAKRMHRLIDDILELSAIEFHMIEVKPEQVMVFSIVNDVTTSLTAYADERNIRLVNNIDPSITVFADPHRLEQMLTNLINNGIKFNTHDGSVTITHERVLKDVAWRDCIRVIDTGDGIAPEHVARIFERFYRVDRARSAGGAGLGLAIVKHLVRAHNGEILVTSQPGKGSEFRIELPLEDRKNELESPEQSS